MPLNLAVIRTQRMTKGIIVPKTLIVLTTPNDIGVVEKMVTAVVNDTAGNLFNHNHLLESVSDPDLSNPSSS